MGLRHTLQMQGHRSPTFRDISSPESLVVNHDEAESGRLIPIPVPKRKRMFDEVSVQPQAVAHELIVSWTQCLWEFQYFLWYNINEHICLTYDS